MKYTVATPWSSPPDDLESRVERCISEASDLKKTRDPTRVFFRADDIGAPGKNFTRLMDLFIRHGAPLCPAIVPTWLTPPRWEALRTPGESASSPWCWHQHGWRHKNHETRGKKQEFGTARPADVVRSDLTRGRTHLESILGNDFYPAFTPPWNRCGKETLRHLHALGYKAVSRSRGASPAAPEGLPDFQVNVDLHTRKERDPGEAWRALFAELRQAAATGLVGVMIHHQRMNDAAFHFLDILVRILCRSPDFQPVTLKELAEFRGRDGDRRKGR